MGMIVGQEKEYYKINVYNTINKGDNLIYIGRDFLNYKDDRFSLYIKNEEGDFFEVDIIKNIDNAYIKSSVHNFSKYDIITAEEE